MPPEASASSFCNIYIQETKIYYQINHFYRKKIIHLFPLINHSLVSNYSHFCMQHIFIIFWLNFNIQHFSEQEIVRRQERPITKAPEGEGCPRCGGHVYAAEQMLARGRVSFFYLWHYLCSQLYELLKKIRDTIRDVSSAFLAIEH